MAPPHDVFLVERRDASRRDPLRSLQRLLDSARRANGLEAVALADATGCLVAGAGAWRACEELAAFAGLAANDTTPTRLDVLASRTEVQRLSVDGIEVFVCGQGDFALRAPALAEAASGCQRILSRSRPADPSETRR